VRVVSGHLAISPSDLIGFVDCPHLTALEFRVARGELTRPFRRNPRAELIRRKGEEHEAAYLSSLGDDVLEIGNPRDIGWEAASAETGRAIRGGAPVIYQAALAEGSWRGLADFLERQPDGTYEVVDTKLAHRAKPGHVLQLCFYTEQLARIQGQWPAQMHVVNGLSEKETFRPDDFFAYYRRLKERFLEAVTNGRATYPYPVDHCSLCEFLALCKQQWREDDHLTLVAGISRTQFDRLVAGGVSTLEALATLDPSQRIRKLRPETLEKLHEQAALQLQRRQTGELGHVALLLVPKRGFSFSRNHRPGISGSISKAIPGMSPDVRSSTSLAGSISKTMSRRTTASGLSTVLKRNLGSRGCST
jgi:predicted RecB family nuclease